MRRLLRVVLARDGLRPRHLSHFATGTTPFLAAPANKKIDEIRYCTGYQDADNDLLRQDTHQYPSQLKRLYVTKAPTKASVVIYVKVATA